MQDTLAKTRVLCFIPVVGDTKDSKRIDLLQQAGFHVTAVAFDRDYFRSRMPDCELVILAKIKDGHYAQRILIMLRSFFKLRKQIRKNDIVYALSPDLALFAYLSGLGLQKKIITDIADIREVQTTGAFVGKLNRSVDRWMAKRTALFVVTARGFITHYYEKILGVTVKDYFLLENKVDYKGDIRAEVVPPGNKLRIGYFGVLRDEWTVRLLLSLAERFPEKVEVVFAGINQLKTTDLKHETAHHSNITYTGPFRSPDDLPGIYGKIDLVALFYPEEGEAEHFFEIKSLCNANRFYEACYFKKPILSFSFCEGGKNVLKHNIGLALNDYNHEEAVKRIAAITADDIRLWQDHMLRLPQSVYTFTDEANQLNSIINQLVKHK